MSNHGKKHVILSDSLSDGRLRSFSGQSSDLRFVRRVCQQIGALSLVTGTSFFLRSEWNLLGNPLRGRWCSAKPDRFLQKPESASGDRPRRPDDSQGLFASPLLPGTPSSSKATKCPEAQKSRFGRAKPGTRQTEHHARQPVLGGRPLLRTGETAAGGNRQAAAAQCWRMRQ